MKKRIDWFDIKTILQNNHITKLYHFTDRSNLDSIVKNGGLISWGDCQEKSIYINAPGGSDLSHVLDEKEGLEDYVRVSFCHHHPMMYYALNEGRIKDPVILEVDIDLLYLDGVIFSDRNAVKKNAQKGEGVDFLRNIHFSTVKTPHLYDVSEEEKEFYQAEILIPHIIPLHYILNINKFVSVDNDNLKDVVLNPIYSKPISSVCPSAIFFLISQNDHARRILDINGEKKSKGQILCDIINETLYNLVLNNKDKQYNSKYDISVIGYHDYSYICFPKSSGYYMNMNKLLDNAKGIRKIRKVVKTRKGTKLLERDVPVWIEPRNCGNSNLSGALKFCYKIVKQWTEKNPNSFPPIVIHITDTGYNDEDHSHVISLANEIKTLSTNDGNTIFINLIFEELDFLSYSIFPSKESEKDRENAFIDSYCYISSYLPQTMNESLPYISNKNEDHLGIAYNLNPNELLSLLETIVK